MNSWPQNNGVFWGTSSSGFTNTFTTWTTVSNGTSANLKLDVAAFAPQEPEDESEVGRLRRRIADFCAEGRVALEAA